MSSNLWVPDAFLRRLCEEFYIGEFHHCSNFLRFINSSIPACKGLQSKLDEETTVSSSSSVWRLLCAFIVFTLRQLDIELHFIFLEESIDNSKKKKKKDSAIYQSWKSCYCAYKSGSESVTGRFQYCRRLCTKSQLREESVETEPEVLLWNDASCKSIPSWHTVLLELS